MAVKTVAILGAGHGGFAAAADLAARLLGRLQARNADRLGRARARRHRGARCRAGLCADPTYTTDVKEAVSGADLIMLVVPSVAHEPYARALAPLLDGSQPIFLNPGHTGGGLHFLHELRKAGYTGPFKICETVSLTYVTRMEGPATVGIYSYIKHLGFGALPGKYTGEIRSDQATVSGHPQTDQRDRVRAREHERGLPSAGHDHECGLDRAYRRRLPILQGRHHAIDRACDRGGRYRAYRGREGIGRSVLPSSRPSTMRASPLGRRATAAISRAHAARARRTRPSSHPPRSTIAMYTRMSATGSCRWPRSDGSPAFRRPLSMRWYISRAFRLASTTRKTASRSKTWTSGKIHGRTPAFRRKRRLIRIDDGT